MELIYTDENKKDIDIFTETVDFETGDQTTQNNFEIASRLLKENYWLYAPGTEWGGVVEYIQNTNDDSAPVWMGHTFRGLMMLDIIEPLEGNDHRIVSGELNTILRELLGELLGGFFVVPEKDSGLTITSYQFPLHVSYGTGIMDMLRGYDYRLYIHAEKETPGEPFVVYAEAVPNKILAGQFDEDSRVTMYLTNDRMGYNHLICLGKGELQERERIDLYLQPDGSITKTQYYTGFDERTTVYENSNAESLTELENEGIKRLKEIMSKKTLQISIPDEDYEIGDVVVGIDRSNNLRVEKPIIGKILRKSGETEEIEYKVGD